MQIKSKKVQLINQVQSVIRSIQLSLEQYFWSKCLRCWWRLLILFIFFSASSSFYMGVSSATMFSIYKRQISLGLSTCIDLLFFKVYSPMQSFIICFVFFRQFKYGLCSYLSFSDGLGINDSSRILSLCCCFVGDNSFIEGLQQWETLLEISLVLTADNEFLGCFLVWPYEDSLTYWILEKFKYDIGDTDSLIVLLRSLLCLRIVFYVDYAFGSWLRSSQFLTEEDMIQFLWREVALLGLALSRVEYFRSLILFVRSVYMVRFLLDIQGSSRELLNAFFYSLREFQKCFFAILTLAG